MGRPSKHFHSEKEDVEKKATLFPGEKRKFMEFFGLVYANVQFLP